MARLIDADKLCEYWLHNGQNERIYNTNDFLDSINYEPTIDAAPVVHAHWIDFVWYVQCSKCNCCATSVECIYCPGCGAKMDEVSK